MYIKYVEYHLVGDLSFQGNEHFEFVQKVERVIMFEITPEKTDRLHFREG